MKSRVVPVVDAKVMIVVPVTQKHAITATHYLLQRNSLYLRLENVTVAGELDITLTIVTPALTPVDMILMTRL
jgi:hypothetical protein